MHLHDRPQKLRVESGTACFPGDSLRNMAMPVIYASTRGMLALNAIILDPTL